MERIADAILRTGHCALSDRGHHYSLAESLANSKQRNHGKHRNHDKQMIQCEQRNYGKTRLYGEQRKLKSAFK